MDPQKSVCGRMGVHGHPVGNHRPTVFKALLIIREKAVGVRHVWHADGRVPSKLKTEDKDKPVNLDSIVVELHHIHYLQCIPVCAQAVARGTDNSAGRLRIKR